MYFWAGNSYVMYQAGGVDLFYYPERISDNDSSTSCTMRCNDTIDQDTLLAEIGVDTSDTSKAHWDTIGNYVTNFDSVKLQAKFYNSSSDGEGYAVLKYGIMVGGSFQYIGDLCTILGSSDNTRQTIQVTLSTTDFGTNFVELRNLRIQFWYYKDGGATHRAIFFQDVGILCEGGDLKKFYTAGYNQVSTASIWVDPNLSSNSNDVDYGYIISANDDTGPIIKFPNHPNNWTNVADSSDWLFNTTDNVPSTIVRAETEWKIGSNGVTGNDDIADFHIKNYLNTDIYYRDLKSSSFVESVIIELVASDHTGSGEDWQYLNQIESEFWGDIVKGGDGIEMRQYVGYISIWEPDILAAGDIVSLLALTSPTTAETPLLVPGAMTISPSLQTVISSIENLSAVITTMTIPVNLLDSPVTLYNINVVNQALAITILLNLLPDIVSGIQPTEIIKGVTTVTTDPATIILSAETVTQEYSGLVGVDLTTQSISATPENAQIAPGLLGIDFSVPLGTLSTEDIVVETGAVTVGFLAHVMSASGQQVTKFYGSTEIEVDIVLSKSGIPTLDINCLLQEILLDTLQISPGSRLISIKALGMNIPCHRNFSRELVNSNLNRELIEVNERGEIEVSELPERTINFEYKP